MHTYLNKKLNISFVLCVSLLIVTSVLSFITISRSTVLGESIQRHNLIIRQLELLLANVKDAETGVRGFAFTHDTFFLTPYVGTHEKVIAGLDNLFNELKTSSAQKLDLLRLEAIVNKRFESLEEGLTCMKINAPLPPSLIAEGNIIMDQTSVLVERMTAYESSQVADESSKLKSLGYKICLLNVIAFLLSTISVSLMWNMLKKSRCEKENLRKEMIEKDNLIKQRLDLIKGITEKIAAGNYNLRLKEEDKDALGELTINLNRMATRLENSFNDLNESMNKKDKFMNIAAHELKTPLTIIKSSLEIIKKLNINGNEGQLLHEFNSKAINQINYLTHLVKNLLDVSRINENRLELKLENFSLEEVILESSGNISKKAQPEIEFVEQLRPTVYADKIKVKEVLSHFISNAHKYSPKESEVSIEVKTEGEHVKVAVKDRGIGIPKEKLPFIFDKYFRMEDSTNNFSGLGLGLFISKSIIEAHRGHVGVERNAENGSTFWFTLPLRSHQKSQLEVFNKVTKHPPQISQVAY